MHIPYSDNKNQALFGETNKTVPLVYFNIINLKKGESYEYQLSKHESSVVPATGIVEITVEDNKLGQIGKRTTDVWDGEPEGSYIPTNSKCKITCLSDSSECFIAGGIYEKKLEPFLVLKEELDVVQYGSDDTKTHRKIKHILGAKHHDQVGRLLVNELYTVGAGGWSGFPPHKHDTDDLPQETRHDDLNQGMVLVFKLCNQKMKKRVTAINFLMALLLQLIKDIIHVWLPQDMRCIILQS